MIPWLECFGFFFSMPSLKLRLKRTLQEVLSSIRGKSPKITHVYRGSATMRQCSGQRWACLLFLFHLWSKHFTLWHTPMHLVTPKIRYETESWYTLTAHDKWIKKRLVLKVSYMTTLWCYDHFSSLLTYLDHWDFTSVSMAGLMLRGVSGLWMSFVLFTMSHLKNLYLSELNWCVAPSWRDPPGLD